ncbi:MAG: copper-binding protein [Caulobacterales bacterium]|nr:copper-binding protein [Caulobacterales bacterium]
MRLFAISTVAALALTACNEPAAERTATVPADTETPAASQASSVNQSGSGTGVVTAVDAVAGSVTLEHGPIAEMDWPAMTMNFAADGAILEGVEVGDEVAFEVSVADGSPRVTALRRQSAAAAN